MRASRTEGFTVFAAGRAGHLFRSACLLTSGDVHLAEDLVQETVSRMYVLWGRARRIDNPAAYAQTVLVPTFLTHRRPRRPCPRTPRRNRRRRRPTPDAPPPTAKDAARTGEPSPDPAPRGTHDAGEPAPPLDYSLLMPTFLALLPDGLSVTGETDSGGELAVTMDRLTALAASPEWPKLQQR